MNWQGSRGRVTLGLIESSQSLRAPATSIGCGERSVGRARPTVAVTDSPRADTWRRHAAGHPGRFTERQGNVVLAPPWGRPAQQGSRRRPTCHTRRMQWVERVRAGGKRVAAGGAAWPRELPPPSAAPSISSSREARLLSVVKSSRRPLIETRSVLFLDLRRTRNVPANKMVSSNPLLIVIWSHAAGYRCMPHVLRLGTIGTKRSGDESYRSAE